ncbi:MAG: adenylate/guanylate cyclase domain-containing protein [Sterolibacterium sp.]|nr:adenylate/guanylate cyclase domain-containing protein [Sterolibacterium sp.]
MNIIACFLALGILLLTEILFRQGSLGALENEWDDLWFRLAGKTSALTVSKVALVEIDEATLAAFPDDPLVFWTPHYARACAVLRAVGVKTIGLDILFSISPESWLGKVAGADDPAIRNFDRTFREQLASGDVIITATHQSGPEPLLPVAEFLAALPNLDMRGHIGATNLLFDRDGALRRVRALAPGADDAPEDGLHLLSFPLLLALHASGQSAQEHTWRFGAKALDERQPPWKLAFSGPPGSITRLSMREVIAEGAEKNPRVQALAGKVVIIGPAFGGSNDIHMTPYGHGLWSTALMSGPEIHAQTTDALLHGRFFTNLPVVGRIAVLSVLLACALWFWLRLPIAQGVMTLGLLLALMALGGDLLHQRGLNFPLAHMQLALLLLFGVIYGLRFVVGERERNRVRAIFSRYVSGEIVANLIDAGEMPALGGQSLDITVLFSDIRNFTTLSERLQPEEVVEMLNRWFTRACAVLQEEGGCIDKFIGDAVMAEFGVPLPTQDHARRAVRAALKLSQVADEMQTWVEQRFTGRDLPPFAIGVGLHSGKAVVGNIGSMERMEYTAIGDTVNLASRLEGVTKQLACTVVASRATVDLAGTGLQLGRTETLAVKGRNEPVEVFAIEGMEQMETQS